MMQTEIVLCTASVNMDQSFIMDAKLAKIVFNCNNQGFAPTVHQLDHEVKAMTRSPEPTAPGTVHAISVGKNKAKMNWKKKCDYEGSRLAQGENA